jgi:hypothetical protein
MTTTPRSTRLTTSELHNLDVACQPITRAFGGRPPYLVGTAGHGTADSYRDVDVRMMLDEAEFAAVCPTLERWELLCMAISTHLRDRTGLPIDFQIQRSDIANERYSQPRNPLGLGHRRVFAGGGDGTPEWPEPHPAEP